MLNMSRPSNLTQMFYEVPSIEQAGHGTPLETRRASEQLKNCSGFLTSPTTAILMAKGVSGTMGQTPPWHSSRCWRNHAVAVTTFQILKWSRPGRNAPDWHFARGSKTLLGVFLKTAR